METIATRDQIEAEIGGQISGQVAVGKQILQIGAIHGGSVSIALPGQIPDIQSRSAPVLLRPKPFPSLVNRHDETRAAMLACKNGLTLEFVGDPGIGKTVLLRYLAYHLDLGLFPDGIIYENIRGFSLGDILQILWKDFYSCTMPYKATEHELRHSLQEKKALILLDDNELGRDEMERLVEALANCCIVFSARRASDWTEIRSVALGTLSASQIAEVVTNELKSDFLPDFQDISNGSPPGRRGNARQALRAAALLAMSATDQKTPKPVESDFSSRRSEFFLDRLSESQRAIVDALQLFDLASVHYDTLAVLVTSANLESDLQWLLNTYILECEDRRYRLADDLSFPVSPMPEEAKRRYVGSIAREICKHRTDKQRLRGEVLLILEIVDWGVELKLFEEIFLLVRSVEWIFILDGLWEAWLRILRNIVKGARVTGDKAILAWALHECGTRALCLGDVKSASDFLNQAYLARKELGDVKGATASSKNLKHINLRPPHPPFAVKLGFGMLLGVLILCFVLWIVFQVEILEFRADHSVITPGEQVEPQFRLTNAKAAHIEPEVGVLPSLTSGTVRVSPRESSEYTLVATGFDGRETRRTVSISIKLASTPPEPAFETLSMARGSIAPGESVAGQVRLSAPALRDLVVSLSTDSPDAVRVPASVRIGRGQSEASFLVVGVLSGNSERRVVRIIGHLEGVKRSAQLLLIPRSPTPTRNVEILEFSADPPVITPGEEVVLSFRLANAQTAHIEPDVGALPSLTSGTVRVRPQDPGSTLWWQPALMAEKPGEQFPSKLLERRRSRPLRPLNGSRLDCPG